MGIINDILLQYAELKQDGLTEENSPLMADIIKTINQLH